MKKLDLADLKNFKDNSVVTLGFFDGIHLAHQEILNNLVNYAKQNNYKSVVITFDDSILKLFKITDSIFTTIRKKEILETFDIDYIIELSINDNFMGLLPDEFVKQYLDRLNCKCIVCGTDFSFGKDKLGNAKFIKENTNIELIEVPDLYDEDIKISSTYIRRLLRSGDIERANALLIEPFSITSKVVHGKQIGKTINYKTCNLELTDQSKLLKPGVYFSEVFDGNIIYYGITNVGYNPTISNDNELTIETHLLDVDMDFYGKELTVSFLKYLREDYKFNSIDELKEQIKLDEIEVRKEIDIIDNNM